MPLVSAMTPLGKLLRKRRETRRTSWKRLMHVVGLEDETMMRWERGTTKDPPISKALLFAEEVGVPLEELAATILGRPYQPRSKLSDASSDPGEQPSATRDLADELVVRDEELGSRKQRPARKRRP